MNGVLPMLLLGVVLGIRHATDADHVVAVSTIVTRQGSVAQAMRIGALWGVGHTFTILLAGGGLILLDVVVPARVGLAMEFAVGIMLVGLGACTIADSGRPATATPSGLRPVLVGVVHGLAGSAAVALLVLATIGEPRWAIACLALFGLGTIIGMMGVTAAVAAPMALVGARFARFDRAMRLVSGGLSIAVGIALATHVTLVGGLFAASPHWTPG